MFTSITDNNGKCIKDYIGEPPAFKKDEIVFIDGKRYIVLEVHEKRNLAEFIVKRI